MNFTFFLDKIDKQKSLLYRIQMNPIGKAITCYNEKFSIPRQSGLVPHSFGHIELKKEFKREEALRGLDSFSHLFLIWTPHQNNTIDNKLTVRPPRLGGNNKVGVFASRSPFRPNPICHSVVELDKIEQFAIHFKNHDILDQTPILDIKPYIPEWDAFPSATSGWASENLKRIEVKFCDSILIDESFKTLIREVLSLGPQPQYQLSKANNYGFRLNQHEVRVSYEPDTGFSVYQVLNLLNLN